MTIAELASVRAALEANADESTLDAARRLGRERDEARAEVLSTWRRYLEMVDVASRANEIAEAGARTLEAARRAIESLTAERDALDRELDAVLADTAGYTRADRETQAKRDAWLVDRGCAHATGGVCGVDVETAAKIAAACPYPARIPSRRTPGEPTPAAAGTFREFLEAGVKAGVLPPGFEALADDPWPPVKKS